MPKRREVRSEKPRRADAQSVQADPTVELSEYVADLAYSLLERDTSEIRRLLRAPLSARLPLEVRAEAMQFTRLPEQSVRAPIQTLRFAHRLHELHAGSGAGSGGLQIDLFGQETTSW
jgi:hypothetical protein